MLFRSMNANIWIKALNTRLLAEPNWALKAGYLVLLIAATLALAAFLLLRATGSFVGYMVVQTTQNALTKSSKAEPVDDEEDRGYKRAQFFEGYDPSGSEAGFYVDGTRID